MSDNPIKPSLNEKMDKKRLERFAWKPNEIKWFKTKEEMDQYYKKGKSHGLKNNT